VRRRSFLGALAAGCTAGFLPRTAAATPAAPTLDPAFVANIPGLEEVVAGPNGRYVYGAAGDRLVVADCDTVDAPSIVAEVEPTLDGDPMGGVGDIVRHGERVAVVGPTGLSEGDPPSGAAVFDVSDPANPEQVVEVPTDHSIHNAAFGDGVLYLTANIRQDSPLVAYDISGDEPTALSSWSVVDADDAWAGVNGNLHQTHDVTVRDGYLYVSNWDAGTWIVDVSDPANPTAVTSIGGVDPENYEDLTRDRAVDHLRNVPGNAHNTALSEDGSLLAVGRESFGGEGPGYTGPGGVELYDIDDKTEPQRVCALKPPAATDSEGEQSVSTAHNCTFSDGRLYASWYESGVRVYDVSDPANPETLGSWAAPGQTSFWTAVPLDEGFVGSSYLDPSASRDARRFGENAKLYTFPEPDAGDAVPAATYEVSATGVPEQPPLYEFREAQTTTTTTQSTTSTRSTTTSAETTTTTTSTEGSTVNSRTTADPTTETSSNGSAPGFGVGAAVAGATLAALHRLRGD
jgi:hypothetical protein